jgi:hypothetical protein
LITVVGGFERGLETGEQVSLVEWLGQETDRAGCHRLLAPVGMGRDQDDGDMLSGRGEMALKLDAAHAGHLHVEHQARRCARDVRAQEVLRGRERHSRQPHRSKQTLLRPLALIRRRPRLQSGVREPSRFFLLCSM